MFIKLCNFDARKLEVMMIKYVDQMWVFAGCLCIKKMCLCIQKNVSM